MSKRNRIEAKPPKRLGPSARTLSRVRRLIAEVERSYLDILSKLCLKATLSDVLRPDPQAHQCKDQPDNWLRSSYFLQGLKLASIYTVGRPPVCAGPLDPPTEIGSALHIFGGIRSASCRGKDRVF
jgi:hypothetical protein